MKFLKYFSYFLLLILLIVIVRSFLTPSISYDTSTLVDKPIEETWAVISDVSKVGDWIQGFVKAELVSGTEGEVGAVSNIYIEEQGTQMMMIETITASIPNEKIAMSFSMDPVAIEYQIILNKKDGKTEVQTKTETRGSTFFGKCIIPWMSGGMKTQEDKNVANLKRVIETNTTNYFEEEDASPN